MGEVQDGTPHGKGKLVDVFSGALLYEGSWQCGQIRGFGTFYKGVMRLQGVCDGERVRECFVFHLDSPESFLYSEFDGINFVGASYLLGSGRCTFCEVDNGYPYTFNENFLAVYNRIKTSTPYKIKRLVEVALPGSFRPQGALLPPVAWGKVFSDGAVVHEGHVICGFPATRNQDGTFDVRDTLVPGRVFRRLEIADLRAKRGVYLDESSGLRYKGKMNFTLKPTYPRNAFLFDPRLFSGRGKVIVAGKPRRGYFMNGKRIETLGGRQAVFGFASDRVEYVGELLKWEPQGFGKMLQESFSAAGYFQEGELREGDVRLRRCLLSGRFACGKMVSGKISAEGAEIEFNPGFAFVKMEGGVYFCPRVADAFAGDGVLCVPIATTVPDFAWRVYVGGMCGDVPNGEGRMYSLSQHGFVFEKNARFARGRKSLDREGGNRLTAGVSFLARKK